MPEEIESESIPSVKDLASSEPSIRRACLKSITTHLHERDPSSPLTLSQSLQLWRGLYVAMYMHDSKNAISVQNLIAELAGTVRTMALKDAELATQTQTQSPSASWLDTWTAAFWETICREWASVDQWRMNKVLLLVRFFLRALFNLSLVAVQADESGSESTRVAKDLIATAVRVLEAWPLSPRERKVPDGLRLHVLDVWVDELVGQLHAVQEAGEEAAGTDTANAALIEASKDFMAPVERLSKEALSKGVRIRAKETVKLFAEKTES